jgi:hypothetical protein
MNAIKNKSYKLVLGLVGCVALLASQGTLAAQGLDSRSQTKVNSSLAKGWSKSDVKKDGYEAVNDKSLVNIGSRRGGNCAVNVGTAKPGEKAPKEIVVTTKEVINICK